MRAKGDLIVNTALSDLRRGGSSNDAEITERVRVLPRIIEWESSGGCGGGVLSPSEGNSPTW